MNRKKIQDITGAVADRLESLFDSMLFFWFAIPLFVGLLEQISGGTPVRFSELFAPVLTTPFLLWHRLGFLFSEYCFRPDPGSAAGNVFGIMILIWSAAVHIGCLVLTVLFSVKPKLAYWLPAAVIIALGSIRMREILEIMCGP